MNLRAIGATSDDAAAAGGSRGRREEEEGRGNAAGRRSFLRRGAGAAAAALAAFAGRDASAQAVNPNYLPSLYRGENSVEFQTIQSDENAHVQYLVNALGGAARPMPTFQNLAQPNLVAFANLSRAFENTGVGAYLGAVPYIYNPAYTVAAATIMDIEARHAGYLNVLLNQVLTSNATGASPSFEASLTIDQVVAAVTPFVASLNGGPPLSFSMTPSAANDIAILNFALALEYLEASFYNINVPMFAS